MNRRLFDVSQLYLTPDYVEDTLRKPPHDARCVAFNWSGTILAVGCADGVAVLWDFETRSPIKTLEGHTGTVAALVWSRNGRRLLSASHDGSVAAWKVETGTLEWVTKLNEGELLSLSADARASSVAAATPVNGCTQIVNLVDGSFRSLPSVIAESDSKGSGRQCVTVSRDGTLLLAGQTRATIVAYASSDLNIVELFKIAGTPKSTRVSQLELSQRGDRLVALCSDRMLRIYGLNTAAVASSPRLSPESACDLLLAAQGNVWGPLVQQQQQQQQQQKAPSPDKGSKLSCEGSNPTLLHHIRDISVAEEHSPALATFDAEADHIITVPSAALSPRDHELRMYDSATGAKTTLAVASAPAAIAIAATPQHRLSSLTSVTAHGHVYIWGREYRENWSAFAPRFQELTQNEEYNEREDEFDSNPREKDDMNALYTRTASEDDVDVDVTGADDDAASDSDSSMLQHLPLKIEADPDLLKYDHVPISTPHPPIAQPVGSSLHTCSDHTNSSKLASTSNPAKDIIPFG